MSERALVFVDANTVWHRRLAEALGREGPTVALLPGNDLMGRADPPDLPAKPGAPEGETVFRKVGLPPGWGSRTAAIGQRLLAHRIAETARALGSPAIVLTSPAYAPLAERLSGTYPIAAYIADDYRSYAGWRDVEAREARLLKRADLRVFVSRALRDRAVDELGLPVETTLVSPNATEPRFARADRGTAPASTACDRPAHVDDHLRGLARPILGVLGGVSTRLDLETIRQATDLPAVGSLLIAGPVAPDLVAKNSWLQGPKVRITGRLPHGEMHHYALAMDAALIPYAATPLNHFCSPMRLYDHLAAGGPVFALDTCDQIDPQLAPGIHVGARDDLLQAVEKHIEKPVQARPSAPLVWATRARAFREALNRVGAVTSL